MRFAIVTFCFLLVSLPLAPAVAEDAIPGEAASPADEVRCEHGVKSRLCARCNPRLAPVYKAKGDWCGEHERPESQCAICNPKLEKEGVRP